MDYIISGPEPYGFKAKITKNPLAPETTAFSHSISLAWDKF